MKTKLLLSSVLLVGLIWFVGCNDSDTETTKTAFAVVLGNGQTNTTTTTNGTASLVGSTLNHSITSGTDAGSSTFSIMFEGTPGASSGTFRTVDPATSAQTTGTFSTSATGNMVLVNMQDSTLGTVSEELVPSTSTSGTFRRNVGTAPPEQGTFTLQ
jgi:hypothetical protein